jgi:hypothetical protein
MKIQINFKNFSGLECCIQDTELGKKYFSLVKENYQQSFPIYREELKYTPEYFQHLAMQAKKEFGWNWTDSDIKQIGVGALLHKDLEILLLNGFENISEKHDNLIHELHYALHLNQHKSYSTSTRGNQTTWFQIEWYNDSGFELDTNFKFEKELKMGAVKLQNPFVGHGPLQMWFEQDFNNIEQTCKFHTLVRPGINVVHTDTQQTPDINKIISKFQAHAPAFVKKHGVEKIQRYIGYPVIGWVENLDVLQQLKLASHLELHNLEFYD